MSDHVGKPKDRVFSRCGSNFRSKYYRYDMSRVMRKPAFCICENKDADQLAVTAKLISAFVFATRIVQSLFFLDPNFKPLAIFRGCTARFVSDLVGNPEDRFSHNEAHIIHAPNHHDKAVGMWRLICRFVITTHFDTD